MRGVAVDIGWVWPVQMPVCKGAADGVTLGEEPGGGLVEVAAVAQGGRKVSTGLSNRLPQQPAKALGDGLLLLCRYVRLSGDRDQPLDMADDRSARGLGSMRVSTTIINSISRASGLSTENEAPSRS